MLDSPVTLTAISCPDSAGPLPEIQLPVICLPAAARTLDLLLQENGCLPNAPVCRSRLNKPTPKSDLADPHAIVEMEDGAAVWLPRAASGLTSNSWPSLASLACRVAAGRATENRGHEWFLNCCLILDN